MEHPTIHNTLTWEKINAFPIKSKDMSIRELRQLCVDFFRFNKTVLWTPNKEYTFIKSSKTRNTDTLTPGTVYAGFPYAMGTGNCYRLMDYIDENGVADVTRAAKCFRMFASQCSIGAWWGWGRVISSARYDWTQNMSHGNGFLRVGEYTYDDKILDFAKGHNTIPICEANGEQVMFRSYALLQTGDGMVYYTTAGHVVMVSSDAHVEYLPDGSIDGENSFVTVIDQTNKWLEEDGVTMKANVDAKWNFDYLFAKHYLPFTFPEFLGEHPIEDTVCEFSHKGQTITGEQLFHSKITCNYGIADAYATVTDGEGREIYHHAVRCVKASQKELAFVQTEQEDEVNLNGKLDRVDFWGQLPVSGTYDLTVEVQLATGERPIVYSGRLTMDDRQL